MDKKTLLAVALIPVMGVALYFSGLFDSFFAAQTSQTAAPSADTAPAIPPPEKIPAAGDSTPLPTKPGTPASPPVVNDLYELEVVEKSLWGRDPFRLITEEVPAELEQAQVDAQEQGINLQQLQLDFTFFNGKEWVASINRTSTKKGDHFGQEEVIEISKNTVHLNSKIGDRVLSTEKSSIGFSIEKIS